MTRSRNVRRSLVAAGAVGVLALAAVLTFTVGRVPLPGSTYSGPPDPRTTFGAGGGHTCAVQPDGRLLCWGDDESGQLGLGIRTAPQPPRTIEVGSPVRSVASGSAHTCVVTTSGEVRCWGSYVSGTTEDGAAADSTSPVTIEGLRGVHSLSAGSDSACAVTADGAVKCWGANGSGQLGNGAPPLFDSNGSLVTGLAASGSAVGVQGLGGPAVSVSAGDRHACALLRDGTVECWGHNDLGQLGSDQFPVTDDGGRVTTGISRSPVPVAVKGLGAEAVEVSAGSGFTCAVLRSGAVKCWGTNENGELGIGQVPVRDDEGTLTSGVANRAAPSEVVGLDAEAASVSAGGGHACALLKGGAVRCWGANASGQLGIGQVPVTDDRGNATSGVLNSGTPGVPVALTSEAVAISAGVSHTCALLKTGSIECWGSNWSRQLGRSGVRADGSPAPVRVPVAVAPMARNAVVNIVMVERADGVRGPTSDKPDAAQRLLAGDRTLLDTLRRGFREATAGRLDPTIEVTLARGRLASGKCVDPSQTSQIENLARPRFKDGAVNLVVAATTLCRFGDESVPPQESFVEGIAGSSVVDLAHAVIHQYGHAVGLKHAIGAMCTNPVVLGDCSADEGRGGSVMTLSHLDDAFAASELARMGLLAEDEVAEANARGTTQYRLAGLWASGTKVVRLRAVAESSQRTLSFSRSVEGVDLSFDGSVEGTRLRLIDAPIPDKGAVIYQGAGVSVTYQGVDDADNAVIQVIRP